MNKLILYSVLRFIVYIIIAIQIQQETGWWTFALIVAASIEYELRFLNERLKDYGDRIDKENVKILHEETRKKSGFQYRLEAALREQKRVQKENRKN